MEKPQENVKYERKLAGRSTSLWSAHKVSYGSDLACTCLTHLATSLPWFMLPTKGKAITEEKHMLPVACLTMPSPCHLSYRTSRLAAACTCGPSAAGALWLLLVWLLEASGTFLPEWPSARDWPELKKCPSCPSLRWDFSGVCSALARRLAQWD